MAVTVEFDNQGRKVQAVMHHGTWSCDDADVLRYINASAGLGEYEIRSHTPHPDLTLAKFVIDDLFYLEGTIIHSDPAPPRPHQKFLARLAEQRKQQDSAQVAEEQRNSQE